MVRNRGYVLQPRGGLRTNPRLPSWIASRCGERCGFGRGEWWSYVTARVDGFFTSRGLQRAAALRSDSAFRGWGSENC